MKKIICVLLSAVMFFITACSDGSKELSPSSIAKEQATTILDCLKTGETEELKSLFCEDIQNTHDLDKEIADAIEFIDGTVIDDGTWWGMSEGGKSVRDGIVTELHIDPGIDNILTNKQKSYSLFFHTNIICVEDEGKVGMTYVIITNENKEEFIIGESLFGK